MTMPPPGYGYPPPPGPPPFPPAPPAASNRRGLYLLIGGLGTLTLAAAVAITALIANGDTPPPAPAAAPPTTPATTAPAPTAWPAGTAPAINGDAVAALAAENAWNGQPIEERIKLCASSRTLGPGLTADAVVAGMDPTAFTTITRSQVRAAVIDLFARKCTT